jgi:hypothetical protein
VSLLKKETCYWRKSLWQEITLVIIWFANDFSHNLTYKRYLS